MPTSNGLRILVVDPNCDVTESYSLLFKLWGHKVQVAHDGLGALKAAKAYRPEVILLEIALPGISGLEVAQRLREHPAFEDTLLVAVTCQGQPEDRQRSLAAGFDFHWVKPIDPASLKTWLAGFPERAKEHSPPAARNLLVVEDDPAVRKMLTYTFQGQGFEVRLAANGPEAVAVFRQHHRDIAVVLLDVQMPGMDGPQTLAALRGIDPKVHCCFMSGHTGRYSREDLLALGVEHVLPKPFRNLSELTHLLRGFAGV